MGRIATAVLSSLSPYSQSRFHNTAKLNKEIPEDYEERTWRERLHIDDQGNVYIPPMALKNCISEAAKFLSIQIPGKGKATYTKHFEAGVMVLDPMPLKTQEDAPIHKEAVRGDWIFTPIDGVKGGGKRVQKCYPVVDAWRGTAEFLIVDDTITEKVFLQHLEQAGSLIGLGRFRVRNGGYYGRFRIERLDWQDMSLAA